MRRLFLSALILSLCYSVSARTLFVYIEEKLTGDYGIANAVREGIFDYLFNEGYIVFDDSTIDSRDNRIKTNSLGYIFFEAEEGGADFIIVLELVSQINKIGEGLGQFVASCNFYLYEAKSGRLIFKGIINQNNKGKEADFKIDELGFKMGKETALKIHQSLLHN